MKLTNKFQRIVQKLTANPKIVALLDGLGAALTAFSLGVIMVLFNDLFGMPKPALYLLASIAAILAIYSLGNYFLLRKNWGTYLKTIITANLAYCCISIIAVIYFLSKLTTLGLVYFILEVIIIVGVVVLERKTLSKIKA